MLSSTRGISVQKLQKGRIVAVHKNWAQNRQATAVCDFCNRRNISLQTCQDCIINICKTCMSQGTLQKDPRHMLASEAAESFEWHTWGKEKTTGALPYGKKRKDASCVSTPESENSPETALSPKCSGEPSEYPAPGNDLQYPPVQYNYLMPMIHNQRYNHGVPGSQPAGLSPHFNQYPQVPLYPYYLQPHGVYGYPASQPIYNHAFPQQPTYGSHSPQILRLSPESSMPEATPVPNGRGKALRSFRELSSQPEPNDSYSPVACGRLMTEIPQAPQAPPRTPVLPYRSLRPMNNGEPLDRRINNRDQTTPRQQSIVPLAGSPKKPQTSRQSSNVSEQAIQGSKRSREVAEGSGQDSSISLSNSDRRPTKKPRHEIVPRNTEWRSHPNSVTRASKRTSLAFEEDDDDDDEDNSGRPVAKKVRRGEKPQSRVVKVQVKSCAGVQRLREILGIPHAGTPKSAATQNIMPIEPSRSHGRPTFSSQALKKTRLDELLDAAGVQPVPWPAELVSEVPEVERTHQYSVKPRFTSRKDSMSVLPTRHSNVRGQTDDDEAREAAMILLSMRRGY